MTDQRTRAKAHTPATSIPDFPKNEPSLVELTPDELEKVAGGLVFNFKLVAVKTISWS